jgi:hypothetical protein
MPIEFAPPVGGNVQPYQITPPQYTDPLQTLAQMQQLRTGGLQQQTAQLGLEQARMAMNSKMGLIRMIADYDKQAQQEQPAAQAPSPAPSASTQTPTGGFTPVSGYTPLTQPPPAAPVSATAPAAQTQPPSGSSMADWMLRNASKYGVLPDDMYAVQNHMVELKSKYATLTKTQKEIAKENADRVYGAYQQNIPDQGALNAVNKGLVDEGIDPAMLTTVYPAAQGDITSQQQLQAKAKSHLLESQLLDYELKGGQARREEAATEAETLKGAETARNLAGSEIQAAIDPNTGVPSPADYAAIQRRYPKVVLPGRPTPANLATFLRGTVPVKEQPEYDIKRAEAAGMENLTPENIGSMVSGSIDKTRYADQYQRTLNDATNALRLGLGVKGVQAAIKDGSDRIAQRENAIAQAQVTSIPFREAQLQNVQQQALQRSYQFHAGELDKMFVPAMQMQERVTRLNESLAQNTPQADALIAPELLSTMAGGAGSGVRMNEAEINRIVGGRSKWEDLKAAINKWQLDPKKATSITTEQRQEIRALVDAVSQRANERLNILVNARSALGQASGPEQHRVILTDLQNKLLDTSRQPQGGAPAAAAPKKGDTQTYQGHPYEFDGTQWVRRKSQ